MTHPRARPFRISSGRPHGPAVTHHPSRPLSVSVLKICPTCSTEYPANERFCPRDGTALRSQGGSTDLVGSMIGERYHVLKKLGEGGMGQVYLAEHVKMGRKSAVKVMNSSMVHDADAIGRFNREAANASRINHPNVAGIYDFGETSDGLVYLAMEFIEGETLTDLLKANGALPPVRAAEINRQTAAALNVAHDLGIVHRDLKPDNIMITKDHDGLDCVKVVDFGIAKAAGSEAQNVTRTGMVIGTPEYMSPEQLSGEKLDGRSDLYSLALVAFNMLTGKLPFPGESAQTSMIMRLTDKPKQLGDMKHDVSWPAELQQVMDKALERDVSLRYRTAREFATAFSSAVQQIPARPSFSAGTQAMEAPASRPVTREVAPKRAAGDGAARTNRTPVLIGGGVLVVALVVGGLTLLRSGKTADRRAPDSLVVSTVPTSAPAPVVIAAAAAPLPVVPTIAPEEMAKDIATALGHSVQESTARKALTEADRIETRATAAEDKAVVYRIRAQAYGTLGQDAKSCQALRDGVGASKGTSLEGWLSGFLARC